ncbi:DNA-3-methyladenine glycosylase family protein [Sandaracinobacteroides saxicola]|uniref:DNA-3-methyladenine glycosylase II n=1 Tax=Sandaracinobacteroides saxicola TaxID=2759707 RepID=A0A7G5IDW2_9SPHN|nr:DNA-3-methyladenine glycosylase 2 family protein [Sandaracinobacteroides saxicola]QMW21554.1 DNA-3-methyladenine glycosylase 2 family protein [Sandaracinobacteroides saxicola]
MGLTAHHIETGLAALSRTDPHVAAAHARYGTPEPRVRERGFGALMRTIVGQQVSVAAAASIWRKLDAATGNAEDPLAIMAQDDPTLRAAGLSPQKLGYARSLATLVLNGELDLTNLPADDEEAILTLTRVKGLGRWSAEIYLLFAEGRPDIFPAGDLAIQAQIGKLKGLETRPSEKATRALADPWRPHRGAAAVFLWHCYNAPPL